MCSKIKLYDTNTWKDFWFTQKSKKKDSRSLELAAHGNEIDCGQ